MNRQHYVFPNGLTMISDNGGETYKMFQGNYLLHQDIPKVVAEQAMEVFRKVSNPSRDYVCPRCGKEFVRPEGMTEYVCECGIRFKTPSSDKESNSKEM